MVSALLRRRFGEAESYRQLVEPDRCGYVAQQFRDDLPDDEREKQRAGTEDGGQHFHHFCQHVDGGVQLKRARGGNADRHQDHEILQTTPMQTTSKRSAAVARGLSRFELSGYRAFRDSLRKTDLI